MRCDIIASFRRREERFDPSVPPLHELKISLDPHHVFVSVTGEGILLEQGSVDPQSHFGTIPGDTVLQEEEVNVSFEIDEEFEESPVLFQAMCQRLIFS